MRVTRASLSLIKAMRTTGGSSVAVSVRQRRSFDAVIARKSIPSTIRPSVSHPGCTFRSERQANVIDTFYIPSNTEGSGLYPGPITSRIASPDNLSKS